MLRPERMHCPKCDGKMERGYTIDSTYGGNAIAHWVEGAPVKSVWVGVKLKGLRKIEILTFRCIRCGFLESYAPGVG